MKKNVLALSIAAAIGGLGFAGGAFAVTTAVPDAGTTARSLALAPTGIGHMMLVPYFTAQASNATLLSIINTDTTNAKAVKVRFRGAANSDDVYDFQVFMSPGDVWTANVSQDAASGKASLVTGDSSCTKPLNVNGTFDTRRLRAAWTDAKKAENTREGYVEIFNMDDIQPKRTVTVLGIVTASGGPVAIGGVGSITTKVDNELYAAVKHGAGGTKPACSGTAWDGLDTDREYTASLPVTDSKYVPGYTDSSALGIMKNPTSGLMGDWTIINLADASAFGTANTAIFANGNGSLVYFPQMAVPQWTVGYTADPLFVYLTATSTSLTATVSTGIVAAQQYDLPDMSTPYTIIVPPGEAAPAFQASSLSNAIAANAVLNEFTTNAMVNATTDWVFSMPTRRYSVAVNYEALNAQYANVPVAVYSTWLASYFTKVNTTLSNDQICVGGITAVTWDRNEQFSLATNPPVISPNSGPAPQLFCGEASVLTVNNPGATSSGVLHATVALKNVNAVAGSAQTPIVDGWMSIATPGLGYGLPLLGGSFAHATAGSSAYGVNWDHRKQ